MKHLTFGLLAAATTLALGACNRPATNNETAADAAATNNAAGTDPVASAMSAAPESVARNAGIVTVSADGSMQTVREGSNGWTCMPDNPATPGADPMCLDANALKWVEAWISHQDPPAGAAGLAYMLEGGTDASNTEPYATDPTKGHNWIETGPHLMVMGSKEILQGHPANPKPDTSVPYVMWAGTPYAHLMIPIGNSAQ